MAMNFGDTGLVTSWSDGGFLASIITNCKFAGYSMTVTQDVPETTAFASGGVTDATFVSGGMYKSEGTIDVLLGTSVLGNGGSITYTNGYTTYPVEFSISIQAKHEFVPIKGQTWYNSVFGYLTATGSYTCAAGDAAGIKLGSAGTASFSLIDGAGGKQLGGSIRITQIQQSVSPAGVNMVTYSFVFSGGVTTTGTNASPWAADPGARTLTKPVIGALVLQSDTGQTYTVNASYTSIEVRSRANEVTTLSIGWAGDSTMTGFAA
jgi:hypothetical protein